jgi:hypothetical protein
VNQTKLTHVSAVGNNGYGIVIGGLGGGTGSNTILHLDHVSVRSNLVGMRIEQTLHMTCKHSVFESNTNEGIQIYKRTGQILGNLRFDTVWLENNWAGGSASNYNVTVDSQTHDFANGPGLFMRWVNCRFNATGSTSAINFQSWRWGRFDECSGAGTITQGTYASYIVFWNYNGPSPTGAGNRCWSGGDDTGLIGGPNYSSLIAGQMLIGELGSTLLTKLKGTQAMAGTTVAVTFGVTLSSAVYQVSLCANLTGGPFWVTNKATTGFTINAGSSFTGNVDWIVEQ